MMPAEWNAVLAPHRPWQEAYPAVERAARAHLEANPLLSQGNCTTDQLVEALYPAAICRGEGITARKRIYKALAALATRGLADCCSRGPERKVKRGDRMVRPWLWHSPREKNPEAEGAKRCPHCGGEI